MLRLFLPFAVTLAVLATGCVVKDRAPQFPSACADAKPLDVVIGVSSHDISPAIRQTILQAVAQQLTAQIRPGSGGVLVSAYSLDDRSVASEPLRTATSCIPPAPIQPDLQQAPTFQRATLLERYRASKARTSAEVDQARSQLDQFSQQLLALQPPSVPTDIWGFLSIVADEFGTDEAAERVVIIVARDEEIQSTYCDGCHDLRGASVYFLAFDQPSPADEQRRRSDWVLWLSRVGASSATFARSNEPVPALFPAAPTTASAAAR
jgi:hypothetical protein